MQPQVSVANTSSHRQARWFSVPMPMAQAAPLPDACVVDGLWLALKGEKIAEHTQMWHVRMDLEGHASGPLLAWKPWLGPVADFALSPWISDDLRGMQIFCEIKEGIKPLLVLGIGKVTVRQLSKALQRWTMTHSAQGWHLTTYADVWSGQDVVDFSQTLVWSDPTEGGMKASRVRVTIASGEPMALYGPDRGATRLSPNRIQVYTGSVAHGVPLIWHGVISGTDNSKRATHTLSNADPMAEYRRDMLIAATEGPIVASAKWDQNWLAFGVVPQVDDRVDLAEWRRYCEDPGGQWDARLLAPHATTGDTGTQPPFGATKDLMALQGAPWRLLALRDGAYDPRGWFHNERNGEAVTKKTHPALETWMGLVELRESRDTLGKDREQPPNWHTLVPRHVGMDDQHASCAYTVAYYALTGDPIAKEILMRKIAVDEMRAFPKRGWRDAPRAGGRLLQDWAKMAMVLDGDVRDRLRSMAEQELNAAIVGWTDEDEVRPMSVITDDATLVGLTLSQPWMDALYALGALEWHHVGLRTGDKQLADKALDFAVKIGTNLMNYATVRSLTGVLLPITGLKINADGSANPPPYYTFPRDGAVMSQPKAGDDMLVGSAGWWNWFAGAVAAARLGPPSEAKDRADELWATYAHTGSLSQREWWALP